MSAFDDALIQGDSAAFDEMSVSVVVGTAPVRAIVSPASYFGNEPDSSGGLLRVEGQKLEIFSSDLAAALDGTNPIGLSVTIDGSTYCVQQVKNNGNTTTLLCGATAGTRSAF